MAHAFNRCHVGWEPVYTRDGRSPAARRQPGSGPDRWRDPQAGVAVDATVHALLRYLEEAGFAGAPRALGFDSSGREMLSDLPGETIGDRVPWPGVDLGRLDAGAGRAVAPAVARPDRRFPGSRRTSGGSSAASCGRGWLSAIRTRPPTTRSWTASGWPGSSTGISPGRRRGSGIWPSRCSPGCRWRRRGRARPTSQAWAGRSRPASGRGGSICCSTRTASRAAVRYSGRWCRRAAGGRPTLSGAGPQAGDTASAGLLPVAIGLLEFSGRCRRFRGFGALIFITRCRGGRSR